MRALPRCPVPLLRAVGRDLVTRTLAKIVGLGVLDALAVYWCVLFAWGGNWPFFASVAGGAVLTNVIAFSRRAYPARYLAPGVFFLVLMVVFPMGYTVYISFTNYATGHILSKHQVVGLLTSREYAPPDAIAFSFQGFGEGGDVYALLLSGPAGRYVALPDGGLDPAEQHELVDMDDDGDVDRVDGRPALERRALLAHIQELQALRFPFQDGWLRMATLSEFRLFLPQYRYYPDRDLLVDQRTGVEYRPRAGNFVGPEGERLDPGWTVFTGTQNYVRFFFDPSYNQAFLRVLAWTLIWAILSVGLSFILGLALAILLNDRQLRLRKLYRSLLIIPYALPAFISVLIWRGFYNTELGVFNQVLQTWLGVKVPWLTDPFWARFCLVLTNIWLTYPYMLLISLGALQSIPHEMYEAARVDGAGPWRRFTTITLPLLMVSVAPLLIGSFAFTFNNFTLVWLLTEGRPAVAIGERAGATDILLSYAYRLAFEGARGNEWAMASALSVVIFLIVAIISGISFSRTKALEEVSRGL
ncbi:MAG: maltose ABC transporter permease MalF [Candidatus Bipolaricaulaceae bacterium]